VQIGPKADFNGDGTVDDGDRAEFDAAHAASDARADFNDDGAVNALDADAFALAMTGVEPGFPPEPPPDPPDPPDPGELAFQQAADGLVSIEAENSEAAPVGWTMLSQSGVSNARVIKADAGAVTPNSDRSRYAEYRVRFARTGAHNVWVRMRGFSGQYRLRVGLDALSPAVRSTTTDGIWRWRKLTNPVNVTSTGLHVIRVYRKDGNVEADKVVLTPGSFVPSGLGPAESPRT
jgi:hypothetical protein